MCTYMYKISSRHLDVLYEMPQWARINVVITKSLRAMNSCCGGHGLTVVGEHKITRIAPYVDVGM